MACNVFRVTLAIGVSGLTTIALSAIIGWIVIPAVVRHKIADILPLKAGSEARDRWENPPVPIAFSVYIFHVNNPGDILNGALPNVTEVGPYVYRERRQRKVLSDGNGSIVYTQKLLFDFDAEASGSLTEEDVHTVVNVQALALSQVVNNMRVANPAIWLVNSALPKLWPTKNSNPLFVQVKVKDFFFGRMPMYCNQTTSIENVDVKILCEAVKIFRPKTIVLDDEQKGINTFSLFKYKNNSEDGVYEIDTGVEDVTQIGSIKSWNGMTKLSNWKADSCNRIVGTDSTIFRPYLSADGVDSLHIFNTDACRSIKLTRDGSAEYKGINGIKYVTDESTFASVLENHDNYCYCPQSILGVTQYGGCLKSGVVELSSCHRVPVIISHPHFLFADDLYQKVLGLNPDKLKHQAFVKLEEHTGYPLSAASRIQINIFLQSIKEIDRMKNLPDVLMPVVWMEETVELSDELVNEINSQLLRNLEIVGIVRWIIIGLGIALSASAFSYYFFRIRPTAMKNS